MAENVMREIVENYKDRRGAIRFETWSDASIKNRNHWQAAYLRDISATGAQLVSSAPILPRSKTSIKIANTINGEDILLSGEVIWQNFDRNAARKRTAAFSMGIRFEDELPAAPQCFLVPVKRKEGLN